MNKRLRKMMREIEKRGGEIHLAPDLPVGIAELFLREVLECPDCLAEARRLRLPGDGGSSKRDH